MPSSTTTYPGGSPKRREFDGTLGSALIFEVARVGALLHDPTSTLYIDLNAPGFTLSVPFGPAELYRLGRAYGQNKQGLFVAGYSIDFRAASIPYRLEIDRATLLSLFAQIDFAITPGATVVSSLAGHFVLTYLEEVARSGDLGWAFGDTVSAGSYES